MTTLKLGNTMRIIPMNNGECEVESQHERDQRIIKALSEALESILGDDVAKRNLIAAHLIAARAALALAKEAQK